MRNIGAGPLFAGAVELLAGIAIVSDPNMGFATLALLAGIAFIFNGMGMFAAGLEPAHGQARGHALSIAASSHISHERVCSPRAKLFPG